MHENEQGQSPLPTALLPLFFAVLIRFLMLMLMFFFIFML